MKFIFSDLDGTILFENFIKEKDLEAIKKWKKKGNKFVIATGRGVKGMSEIIETYRDLADYYVLNNGSCILDGDLNIMVQTKIDRKIAIEIIEKIDKKAYDIGIETSKNIYTIGEEGFMTHCPELGKKSISIDEKDIVNLDEDFLFINTYPIDASYEKALKLKEFVEENYLEETSVFINREWVDIVPKNVSKATGISYLVDKLSINLEEVFVIGDSYNDLPMFRNFENSYSFADAPVKEEAKEVVEGLWELVEKNI